MRKCAAILCAVLMTVSACACGKNKAPTTKTTVYTTKAPTTTTAPSVNYTEEPGKAPLNLTYATSFSDGVALVSYLDGDGAEHRAAINTAGDVLFELPEDMPFEGEGYKNGVRVVGDVMYDKTGAVIASPEKSGYDSLMTGNCGGYVLAKMAVSTVLPTPELPTSSTTASTSASSAVAEDASATTTTTTTAPTENVPAAVTVSIGVLNNEGEWVHPLSTDHPIARAMAAASQPAEMFTYVTEDVLRVYVDAAAAPQYYHFSTNTLTVDYAHYASFEQQGADHAGIYWMAEDGSKELVLKNIIGDYFFDDAFIGRSVTPTFTATEGTIVGPPKLYDYEGNALMDLSAYPLSGPLAFYQNGYLTLPTTDTLGSRLLVVLDAQGNLAFEPLALGMRDVYYPPDVSGFVVESYTADGAVTYRHYDYTGAVTEYTDATSFLGFYEGLAVVTLRGDTERYYYINHRAEIVLR